jgi:DNA (cytosine-5)-methyltransferase 1
MISGHGRHRARKTRKRSGPTFIDLFAGCGGLSLGLFNAGWSGLFAVEKNRDAFSTLHHNLIDGERHSYSWPKWLPKRAFSTQTLLRTYGHRLASLRGKVDLIAGAPPCQGFSLAGRRTHADPRNKLFAQYLAIVRKVQPRFVLLENVQGFCLPFKKDRSGDGMRYSELLAKRLELMGYRVFSEVVDFSKFGVPQTRNRFVLVGVRKTDPVILRLQRKAVFKRLQDRRAAFLQSKRLAVHRVIAAKHAISDLESVGKKLIPCADPRSKRFKQISYHKSDATTTFIRLMRKGFTKPPTSIRLSSHRPETVKQFKRILDTCQRGRSLSKTDRRRLGIKKQALTPLDSRRPSSTITTLPDDIVHYSEPRILTVRENARLQTFPDWFEFKGNYTTGGPQRVESCPQYTQVGNAVPPLFSEAIGIVLKSLAA